MTEQENLVNHVCVILEETKTRLLEINSSKINWNMEGFIESLNDEIFDLQSEVAELNEEAPEENWFPVSQLEHFRLYNTISTLPRINDCYSYREDGL